MHRNQSGWSIESVSPHPNHLFCLRWKLCDQLLDVRLQSNWHGTFKSHSHSIEYGALCTEILCMVASNETRRLAVWSGVYQCAYALSLSLSYSMYLSILGTYIYALQTAMLLLPFRKRATAIATQHTPNGFQSESVSVSWRNSERIVDILFAVLHTFFQQKKVISICTDL